MIDGQVAENVFEYPRVDGQRLNALAGRGLFIEPCGQDVAGIRPMPPVKRIFSVQDKKWMRTYRAVSQKPYMRKLDQAIPAILARCVADVLRQNDPTNFPFFWKSFPSTYSAPSLRRSLIMSHATRICFFPGLGVRLAEREVNRAADFFIE